MTFDPSARIRKVLEEIRDLITRSKGLDEGYDLTDAILDLTRSGGSLAMDGNEQNLYINDAPAALFTPLTLKVDLTSMASNDIVVLREYYRLKSGGSYIKEDEVSFSDAQTIPLKIVWLRSNLYGVKMTIQQTAGTNRTFDWETYYAG